MKTTFLSKLGELLGRGATSSAEELRDALEAATTDRDALEARQGQLSAQRVDLLLTGDDQALDAVETELTAIGRALDRHEVCIPELRRRLDATIAEDQRVRNAAAFTEAVNALETAVGSLDRTLAEIERNMSAYRAAADQIGRLSDYHGSAHEPDGATPSGNISKPLVQEAVHRLAPTLARSINMNGWATSDFRSLSEALVPYWRAVLDGTSNQRGA